MSSLKSHNFEVPSPQSLLLVILKTMLQNIGGQCLAKIDVTLHVCSKVHLVILEGKEE